MLAATGKAKWKSRLKGESILAVIGNILVFLSFGVFLWAVVGLINPAWARLPHRKISIAGLALSAWLAVAGCGPLPSDDSTGGTDGAMDNPTGDTTTTERQAMSPTDTPCIPTELSPAALELVRLYEELHTFKDDPEFLRVGFVLGGPYSAWMQAIEKQRDTNPGFELFYELGFLPGDLMMLGMNYMDEDVSESDLAAIEHIEGKIQAGLASARCNELGSVQETIQDASEARQRYAAEAEAQIAARESLLGRPLTDEELLDVEFEKLRAVLEAGEEYPGQRAESEAAAELRSLTDRMRAFRDQRIPEHGAALARVAAAVSAAEQGQGTYRASLAAAETYVALTTEIAAEISALVTELAALEATAPEKVAVVAATSRMNLEGALAQITAGLAAQRDLLETQRAMVAELEQLER